ncbi:hypothetical protein VP01_30g10 [Puccinia sorghi]|uniref:ferric-chelate reductase (NADPH) n=1 Tax=Puccinia sorghi TaxID=27349 RepID=A0A0L6V0A5_9BASI|nr:hypothetical protein VP01_30g10 [Puccinia sorghi]
MRYKGDRGFRCGSTTLWSFGHLAHGAFSQYQAPDESAEASVVAAPSMAKMMEGQKIVNQWLASLDYHVLGLCVILGLLVGLMLMIRRGTRAFHCGWFLYGKSPEDTVLRQAHNITQHSKLSRPQLAVLRQIYGFTFLQNVPFMSTWTFGQLMLSSVFLGMVVILAGLSNPSPAQNPRRFGYLAAANIPFLVLFSMKNSPLALLGKGYEKVKYIDHCFSAHLNVIILASFFIFNFIHRFIGCVVIACALIHGVLMIPLWSQGMISNARAFYSGCFMGVMLLLVAITAIPVIRRKFYRAFYFVHVMGYMAVFVGGICHERALRPYMLSAISLHLLSSGWQVLKWRMLTATLTPLPGKITRVEINGIKTGWKAGHHVRLRVLGNFWHGLQAHPFTIASAPSTSGAETNSLILYVKAVGSFTTMLYAKAVTVDGFKDLVPLSRNNTVSNGSQAHVQLPSDILQDERKYSWVQSTETVYDHDKTPQLNATKLHKVALDLGLPDGVQVNVHVEGPYGGVGWHPLDEFQDVIICAGGSGISFLVAAVAELISRAKDGGKTQRALVIFTVRDWEVAKYFGQLVMKDMGEAATHGLALDVRFFVTGKVDAPIPLGDIKLRWHRPQLDLLVHEFLMDVPGDDQLGVFLGACGPSALIAQVRTSVALIDLKTAKRVGGITTHL